MASYSNHPDWNFAFLGSYEIDDIHPQALHDSNHNFHAARLAHLVADMGLFGSMVSDPEFVAADLNSGIASDSLDFEDCYRNSHLLICN